MTKAFMKEARGKEEKEHPCHSLRTYFVPGVVLGIFTLFAQYLGQGAGTPSFQEANCKWKVFRHPWCHPNL